MRDLRPVARDLGPTLRDVRALAPDLRHALNRLDPLVRASRAGLPALRDTLRGLRPMLGELGPFLSQLNPILQYLEASQFEVSDFIAQGGAAVADTTATRNGVGHYLRQIGPMGLEAAAIFGERLPTNRGNSYLGPMGLYPKPPTSDFLIFPNFDCVPTGGKEIPSDRDSGGRTIGCYVARPFQFQGRLTSRFPRAAQADYGGGGEGR
jgi:hypothetical protein